MIDVLDVPQSLKAAPELAAVYLSAFGASGYDEEPARAERFGNEQLPLHSQREGFKLVVARSDGRIAGFAYRRKGWQVLVPELASGSALYGLRLR